MRLYRNKILFIKSYNKTDLKITTSLFIKSYNKTNLKITIYSLKNNIYTIFKK